MQTILTKEMIQTRIVAECIQSFSSIEVSASIVLAIAPIWLGERSAVWEMIMVRILHFALREPFLPGSILNPVSQDSWETRPFPEHWNILPPLGKITAEGS
jgi:hypothetical protein